MGWFFSRKRHPLADAAYRDAETLVRTGELKSAAERVARLRDTEGATPGVRYLEALVYHEASSADPVALLEHLRPALDREQVGKFPEARLLEVRLLGSLGRFDDALDRLRLLGRERLKGQLGEEARKLGALLGRLRGPGALRECASRAEELASGLAAQGVAIAWRGSDLARLDSLLDESPELVEDAEERWTALLGEIATRAYRGTWRFGLRVQDHAVLFDSRQWPVGGALRERLARGAALYDSLHRARSTPRHPVPGTESVEVVVEPSVHPAVVVDHVARRLAAAGASGLGVNRARLTAEGPVVLPLTFVDKSGLLRVAWVETRPWEPERLAELRRWLGRLRASSARQAHVFVLAAHHPPPLVRELLAEPAEPGLPHPPSPGSKSATPLSLDDPKLRWLDEKAEVMESLVRAAMGLTDPEDLELIRKLEQTVVHSFRSTTEELRSKHWSALYGYGALYGRVLARRFGGRWHCLPEDASPAEWEMLMPWGSSEHPIGDVIALLASDSPRDALSTRYRRLQSTWEATRR